MNLTKRVGCVLSLFLITFFILNTASSPASAQDNYPRKPVIIIVPFGVGGSADIAARHLQPFLAEALGTSVIIQNKPGAAGRIGTAEVYRSRPDGYKLLAHHLPTIIMGQLLYNAPYDTRKFSQIYGWVSESMVIAVTSDSPYTSFADLLEASKQKQLTASVVGVGGSGHLQSILLKQVTGLDHRMIPFGSGGKAINALLGKNTDFGLTAGVSTQSHFDSGRVRVLAIHSDEPVAGYENVPTFKQLGYESMTLNMQLGLMGPPGMDNNIVDILCKSMKKAVSDPRFIEEARASGENLKPMNRPEWEAYITSVSNQVESLLPLIKAEM